MPDTSWYHTMACCLLNAASSCLTDAGLPDPAVKGTHYAGRRGDPRTPDSLIVSVGGMNRTPTCGGPVTSTVTFELRATRPVCQDEPCTNCDQPADCWEGVDCDGFTWPEGETPGCGVPKHVATGLMLADRAVLEQQVAGRFQQCVCEGHPLCDAGCGGCGVKVRVVSSAPVSGGGVGGTLVVVSIEGVL